MLRRLQRSFDSIRRAALNKKLAGQIAGGLATGMVIGLLPKDSALPYLIGLVSLALPFSFLASLPSILIFSLISPALDATWDRVGYQALSAGWFQPIGNWLSSIEVMSWTRFNNSVVMGSLICSLAAWPIVYVAGRLIITRLQKSFDVSNTIQTPLATEIDG